MTTPVSCLVFRKGGQQPTTERESKDKQWDAAWQRRGVVSEHTIRRTTGVEIPILSHIKHRPARLLHRHQSALISRLRAPIYIIVSIRKGRIASTYVLKANNGGGQVPHPSLRRGTTGRPAPVKQPPRKTSAPPWDAPALALVGRRETWRRSKWNTFTGTVVCSLTYFEEESTGAATPLTAP